jgi:DNA segregation ATPase FtsK/SpoIIIE, S-DNA-T family
MSKKSATVSRFPRDLLAIVEWIGALFLLLSLLSFVNGQPGKNWLGLIGYGVSWCVTFLMGWAGYLLVAYMVWMGCRHWRQQQVANRPWHLTFLCLSFVSIGILLSLVAQQQWLTSPFWQQKLLSQSVHFQTGVAYMTRRIYLGGVPLYFLYCDLPGLNLRTLLSDFGTAAVFGALLAVSTLMLVEVAPELLMKRIWSFCSAKIERWRQREPRQREPKQRAPRLVRELESVAVIEAPVRPRPPRLTKPPAQRPVPQVTEALDPAPLPRPGSKYQLPPLSLLAQTKAAEPPSLQRDLKQQAALLEETLAHFSIPAKVGAIHCGPRVTLFEVTPPTGVKVQRIKALENDIALNMEAASVRIVAPIPGKAAVGVEVPSIHPREVCFRDMLQTYKSGSSPCAIPFLIGQTVEGRDVVADLVKMPHLIIAGATGSGKSVCINTLILSILMHATPDQVRLLLVDPKKVELVGYGQLPHLVAPVITEPADAATALKWLVRQMDERYALLRQVGVRNIQSYNSRGAPDTPEQPAHLPYIVAMIDELADLMMTAPSDIETPITRIAQMARAVGIHLVLATQRPSREVITGLIKANFPSRIAFKVASRVNSQIILDDMGAETLLGNGDLLFLPPGGTALVRAQGPFVRDEEIQRVVAWICQQGPPSYLVKDFAHLTDEERQDGADGPRDQLYQDAVELAPAAGALSTTFLQRKLKIGYARAASIVDQLEQDGIIGPADGAKPRRVLRRNIDT